MGYCATGSGSIMLRGEMTEPLMLKAIETFSNVHFDGVTNVLDIEANGKYYEDSVYAFLNTILPISAVGELFYEGEDGEFWKIVLKDGEWNEVSGKVSYEDEPLMNKTEKDVSEFIGQLIDQVQDVLDDQENKGWPHGALIIGEFYDDLKNKFTDVLKEWKVL